jgi:hypothetical protein
VRGEEGRRDGDYRERQARKLQCSASPCKLDVSGYHHR